MDKWMMLGGTVLYTLCGIGMLDFLHQAGYGFHARVMLAFFWPLTLATDGCKLLTEAVLSAWE